MNKEEFIGKKALEEKDRIQEALIAAVKAEVKR